MPGETEIQRGSEREITHVRVCVTENECVRENASERENLRVKETASERQT